MNKGWILLIVVIIMMIILFISPTLDNIITGNVILNTENTSFTNDEFNPAVKCVDLGGEWFPNTQECKWITEEDCIDLGGVFNECGPSCEEGTTLAVSSGPRDICVQVCIPLCKI